MSPLSEVLLRSGERLKAGLLLVNWPADDLPALLHADGLAPTLFTQDHAQARQQEQVLCAASCSGGNYPQIVMALPREALRKRFLLSMCAAALAPGGELIVVGEKRSGIKSAPKLMKEMIGPITLSDSARHCGLYAATLTQPAAFDLQDWISRWEVPLPGGDTLLHSLPGVFSHGRMDDGTAMLLEHLPVPARGPVLDIGCGVGVIGLSLAARNAELKIDMVDSNALAVAACALNIREPERLKTFPSDIFSDVPGKYQMIVSNPPFHDGVATAYGPAARLIAEAPAHLYRGGELWLVANRFLDYGSQLEKHFKSVQEIAGDGRYRVLRAR